MAKSACATENTIAEILEGRRKLANFPDLERHVAECDDCRELVAKAGVGHLDPTLPADHDEVRSGGDPLDTLVTVTSDRYDIVRELAHGGMGRILEAWDVRHRRKVAIKMLLRSGVEATRRFVREARITARLQHPGIISLHEAGRWTTGEPFFAMKLVEGSALSVVLLAKKTLSEKLALLPSLIAMTEALAYAHDQGIVHRDLKPSNVLIGGFGETVVIDWGLAKDRGEVGEDVGTSEGSDDPWLTKEGQAMGTVGYMPPEQALGESVDERADVYALGAVLYSVFGGQAPHASSSYEESLLRLRAGPPEPLAKICPDLATDLVTIVEKAMARDPAARYASAREMAADLSRFATGRLVAAHSYSPAALLLRFIKRHRAVISMAAALVLAVGITAGVSVRRIVRERDRADALKLDADRQRSVAVTQRDAAERLVGFMIGDLKTRLEALGKLELLSGVGTEILAYYQTLAPTGAGVDRDVLERRGVALGTLASVEAMKHHFGASESLERSALDAFAAAHRSDPRDPEIAARWVVAASSLPVVLAGAGDADGSVEAAERAERTTAELAANDPRDPREWAALAFARASVASSLATRDDIARAKAAVASAREAAGRTGDFDALDPDWRDVLADVWTNLCAGSTQMGDWKTALDVCNETVATRRKQLTSAPDHFGHLAELAHALVGLAKAEQALGSLQDAVAGFRESSDIGARLLAREPENTSAAYYRGTALSYLCELECNMRGGATALPDCDASHAVLEPLAAARPDDAKINSALGRAWRSTGYAYFDGDRYKEAKAAMQAALERFERAAAENPNSDIQRSDLSGAYRDMGHADYDLDELDAACEAFSHAIALDEKQLAEHPDADFFEGHVGQILTKLGDVERERHHTTEARAAYDRALVHFERALADNPTEVDASIDVAFGSLRIARMETDPAKRAALRQRADDLVAPLEAAGKVTKKQRHDLGRIP